MARKANPKLIGGFVIGAIALALIGAIAFGGGKFLAQKDRAVLFFPSSSLRGLDVGSPVQSVAAGPFLMILASSSRELAPTRWHARYRCPSTLRTDMYRRFAMSLLDMPATASSTISRCRSVSG